LAPPVTSPATQILGSLGDSLNNFRLKSNRIDTIAGGGATLIVYTASEITFNSISKTFKEAGFDGNAINLDALPTDFIKLGKNGAFVGFGARLSNLTLAETSYLFTPNTGYLTLNEFSFPYVHLKPLIPFKDDDFHPLPSWAPDLNQSATLPPPSTWVQSEYAYEPRLWQAAQTVLGVVTQSLAVLAASLKFTLYPQTAFRLEEFGEKYVFEHDYAQHGGAGTRDSAYYLYHPGLVPDYGSLNFSIVVGLRHDSVNWLATGKKTPHTLFWNLVYADSTDVGALMRFNHHDAGLQSYNSLNATYFPGAAAVDPLNVIYVRTTGVTSTTNPAIVQVLQKIGLVAPTPAYDNPLKGVYPLTVIHHAYVNPDTGVAPFVGSIIAPIQIHAIGAPVPHV